MLSDKAKDKKKALITEVALLYWLRNCAAADDLRTIELLDEIAYENHYRDLFLETQSRIGSPLPTTIWRKGENIDITPTEGE